MMKLTTISSFKADSPKVLQDLKRSRQPRLLTKNDEGQAVLVDVESYQELMESIAMLKLLSQSTADVEKGRTASHKQVSARLRKRLASRFEHAD